MEIHTKHGVIGSLMLHPFNGTEEDFKYRDQLFEHASGETGLMPSLRMDVYDESLLVFDSLENAIDFLIKVIDLSSTCGRRSGRNTRLRGGLCTGNYYHHEDQIYGDATNQATQLCFQSRENEVLICSTDLGRIRNHVLLSDRMACFIRKAEEGLVSIGLDDEDCTVTPGQQTSFHVNGNGYRKTFAPQRQLIIEVGRADDCDIIIDHEHVSRSHATITLKQEEVFVEDHSANGTYVYTSDREVFVSREVIRVSGKAEISCGCMASDYPCSVISLELRRGNGSGEIPTVSQTTDP